MPSDDRKEILETRVRELEAELAESRERESRYNALLSEAPVSIWMVDRSRHLVYAQGSALSVLGMDSERVAGSRIDDLFSESDEFDSAIERVDRGETATVTFEHGGRVFETRLSAVGDPSGGERIGVLGVSTDVSERVRAEKSLIEEKERLDVTLSSIGEGVIATDTEGRVTGMNRVAEELTSWKSEKAVGLSAEQVYHVIDNRTGEARTHPVAIALGRGGDEEEQEYDKVLISRDGRDLRVDHNCAPIRRRGGEIIGSVLVFRDLTRQRMLEDEMRRVEKLESIGILAGGIAHDFNNILTVTMGNLSIARRRARGDERLLERLRDAERAVERARRLTGQLLTFAKGGAPVKALVDVRQLAHDAARFALAGSRRRWTEDFPRGLASVRVDSTQIGQVIQNLVINAHQAMGREGEIALSAGETEIEGEDGLPVEPGRYTWIAVRDSGPGIPGEIADRVFDPYFTTKPGGTGLGLAAAHSIIRRHGGHVAIESPEGGGAEVRVFLPAKIDSGDSDPGTPPRGLSAARKGCVLVMDDEPVVLEAAASMLAEIGYEAETARDGAEAVEAYRSAVGEGRRFDATIVDLTVPGGMGGHAAARSILEIDPQARVLVSSGYSEDPVMSQWREHGFCGVVSKPYGVDELDRALRKAIVSKEEDD
ncbi:MAG: PAS domain S-box protein [Polyangia bacterium]